MFALPDLPYDYKDLEPAIDEETMHLHHDKHHQTYVNNLNEALTGHNDFLNMEIEELIKNLGQVPAEIKIKVQNNGGGHLNHSIFWTIMKSGGSDPSPEFLKVINGSFGSLDSMKEQVNKAGLGQFGSGWVWVVANGDKLSIETTANQNNPISEGKTPVLGIDVWEHAYYLKYKNARADYLKAWWSVANWEEIERRYNKAINS